MFYNISRLFARYCGRRPIIIQKTQQLLEFALMIQPENAAFHTEVAFQKTMVGDYANAYNLYLKASQLDGNYHLPLYGMIFCRIKQEMYDDAIQQLEFVEENLAN